MGISRFSVLSADQKCKLRKVHENFEDVIWTDEASIQLDSHKRYCCRKEGERPRPKPRPKHPTKVHVWAGISKKGATGICIFEGKMNAPLFCQILRQTLLPFSSAYVSCTSITQIDAR